MVHFEPFAKRGDERVETRAVVCEIKKVLDTERLSLDQPIPHTHTHFFRENCARLRTQCVRSLRN
jgi:hypothetical protein